MKGKKLKLLSMLLAVVMLISMVDLPTFAAYSDTDDHWADKHISKWSDLGILHGDGKNFRPNDPITRAEIAAILNNLMHYQAKSENKFSDLGSRWYTDAILGANASGIIVGNGNKVRPEDNASREETAVMFSKALAVKGGGAERFIDNVKISAWAVDAVNAMAEKGYISGFPDGSFRPKEKITRAEVAAIVNNAVNGFYSKAGTYTENVNGMAVVNTPDVILKDMTIKGDLILAEGIGRGDVTLDNVKIEGTTIVRGGGENSIMIKNSSKLGTIIVCRIDGKVSVKVQDDAVVERIIVDDSSDDVTLSGEIGNLQVDASDITVTAKAAVLSKVEVSGKNTVLVIDEKSSADTIAFNKGASNSSATINGTVKALVSETAGLKVKGDGKLEAAEIRGNDNKIEVVGAKVTAAAGVNGTLAGTKAVASGTSEIVQNPAASGSTGSGSTTTPTPQPPKNKVSIVEDGVAKASVVIAENADPLTKNAANKLIEYIRKSTGAELPLIIKDTSSSNVIAEDGLVKIIFDSMPGTQPLETDFTVQEVVNDVPGKKVHPNSVTWDEAALTATLKTTMVKKSGIEQKMFYRVWYKDQFSYESRILTIDADLTLPLNDNSSFEAPESSNDWSLYAETHGAILRSDEMPRTGSYSVKASSVMLGWINYPKMNINPQCKKYELKAWYYTPEGSETKGTVQPYINFKDENGEYFSNWQGLTRGQLVEASTSNGKWTELKLEVEVPEKIDDKPVKAFQFGVELKNFANDEVIFLDDIELIMTDIPKPSQAVKPDKMKLQNDSDIDETQILLGSEWLSGQEKTEMFKDMGADGFIINQKDNGIRIAGVSTWGTSFGVNEFLERYVGVRWLMPGSDWEDVPEHTGIDVPVNAHVRQEPAFFSRTYEAIDSTLYREWKMNNRMHEQVYFAHNLYNLFPPSKYKDSHPEFYPPGADLSNNGGWQPSFTNEKVVEEAIKNINAFFDANPNVSSYSIGINDTTNFCEANPDHPSYPNKRNSIGMVDMSDIYFTWVNKVAEGVFAKHPDKYLGCYAYFNVYDPPSENIKIDPRVVVYITDERLSWKDPDMGSAGKALTEAWLKTGATVAFYEYLYGAHYMVPRTYFNEMGNIYKYAADKGVSAFYNELYPNFGEGPKPWLSAKLQWDPYQDVDVLLDEWYERAVGSAAKSDLSAYYDIWQRYWEQDIFKTGWYKGWKESTPRVNFMPVFSSAYLSEVSIEDVRESRRLLELVVAKADTPHHKKRAEDLLQLFGYYEASVLSYPKYVEVKAPENEEDAATILNEAVQRLEQMETRYKIFDEINKNPAFATLGYLEPLKWEPVANDELWAIVRWVKENPDGETKKKIDLLAESTQAAKIKEFTNKILAASYGTGVRNPGFEEGMKDWFDWPDTIAELTDDTKSGSKALKVLQSSREQTVFVEGGKQYKLTFYGKQPGIKGSVAGINFWDVPGVGRKGILVQVDSDDYKKYVITFTAPQNFSNATIVAWNSTNYGPLFVDDFTLEEWNGEEETSQLQSVNATNGAIQAVLDEVPAEEPAAGDFIVQPVIDGVAASALAPDNIVWNAETKTATLTVPTVSVAAVEQELLYKVSYKNGEFMDSEVIDISAGENAPLNLNSSFEVMYDGENPLKPWEFDNKAAEMSRSRELAHTGLYSLKVTSTPWAYPKQVMDFSPEQSGTYKLSAYMYSLNSTTSGTVRIYIQLINENGEIITTFGYENLVHAKDFSGEWKELSAEMNIDNTQAKKVQVVMELMNIADTDTLYFDDVQLVRVSD